jgi:hypothetical protein
MGRLNLDPVGVVFFFFILVIMLKELQLYLRF